MSGEPSLPWLQIRRAVWWVLEDKSSTNVLSPDLSIYQYSGNSFNKVLKHGTLVRVNVCDHQVSKKRDIMQAYSTCFPICAADSDSYHTSAQMCVVGNPVARSVSAAGILFREQA